MSVGSELVGGPSSRPGMTLAAGRRPDPHPPHPRSQASRPTTSRLCGGDVYARGHIRSIARVVGARPRARWSPSSTASTRPHAARPRPRCSRPTPGTRRRAERRGPNWTAAMAPRRRRARCSWPGSSCCAAVRGTPTAGPRHLGHQRGGTADHLRPRRRRRRRRARRRRRRRPRPRSSPRSPPSATGVAVRLSVVGGTSWVSATAQRPASVFEGMLPDGATQHLHRHQADQARHRQRRRRPPGRQRRRPRPPGGDGQVVRLDLRPRRPDRRTG